MKRLIIILAVVLAVYLGKAQQPLGLTDAIGIALENNYGLQIIRQNEKVAEITNNWGTAGRYPYVGLTADNRNSANMNDNENFIQNNFSAGANLSWTIFDGFSVQINKAKFEQLEELSHQNTAIMVEGTIQSVVLAYYSVLLEKEKLDVYQKVMTLSEDRYTQAKTRKEFGTSVTYDVLQAQNAFLSDKASWLVQEVAYKNALRDLNFLMAAEIGTAYNLTGVFEAIPKEYVLSDLISQMTSNNKTLKNQYINQSLLENAVALAKSDFLPSFSFGGGATLNKNRVDYKTNGESWNNSTNFFGNFTLSYNLFSGGNRKRAMQIAKIQEEVGKVEINEMTHDLNNQMANIFEFYQVRKELLSVANENLAAAELNLQISREKFESGTINSFNFRDVQNIYLNAAIRKLEAIYNFIDTHTTLLRMAGTIIQEYE
jgi:outer membrane protein TolC